MLYELHQLVATEGRHLLRALPSPLRRNGNPKWVQEFKDGSEEAYQRIYERFRKPMYSYVRARVRDEECCHDLVQEIFIKVFRFREQYDPSYAFSTWLWSIARNTVADYLRASKARTAASAHEYGEGPLCPETLPSGDPCAETLVHKKSERRRILRLMRSLTRLQRRVLWMRIVQQRSFQDIAKGMGMSLSAVKNLAHRAKIALDQQGVNLASA